MSEEITKVNKFIMVVLYSLSVLFFFISFWFFMYSWGPIAWEVVIFSGWFGIVCFYFARRIKNNG